MWEGKGIIKNSQKTFEKKDKVREIKLSDFKICLKATVKKRMWYSKVIRTESRNRPTQN